MYSENLNGEVGVEHVEAKVDEEVVDADRHQSRIKLELHLDQLKFAFDQWAKKIILINGQENCHTTVLLLLQLCLVVVFKIERSVHEKVFSDHIPSIGNF